MKKKKKKRKKKKENKKKNPKDSLGKYTLPGSVL
jgi:hypothetical protein